MTPDALEQPGDRDHAEPLEAGGFLDRGRDEAFDRLTTVVCEHLEVPIGLLTIVEADRQRFRSSVGLPEPWASRGETPLSHSFCRHVVESGRPLVVGDAREHELVRDNPAVDEFGVLAYAGVPVRGPDSRAVGTVAALDELTREWSAEEVGFLRGVAAVAEVEAGVRTVAPGAASDLGYRELVERLPIGVAVYSDGVLRFANPEAARIAGFDDPAELEGRELATLMPEEERERVREQTRRVEEEGEASPLSHYRVVRPDGGERHVEAASIPVDLGARRAVQVMVRDVTERISTRQALETSEERQRILLEQMPAVVWTTDRDLVFTSSTGAGLEDLGLETGEVVGITVQEFIGTEDEDAPALRMHRRALQGRTGDYAIAFSGRHYQCRVEPLVAGDGEITGVVGCALDITDRVEAEEERRRSEERYRNLLALAPVAMFLDRGGTILFANEAGAELLGAEEPAALVGRSVFDFVSDESEPAVRERIRGVEERGEPSDVRELALERTDGERRYGEIRSIPVHVGEAPASLSIVRDVTDERRARRALLESERRFRSLFEDSRDAIYLTTVDGRIEAANSAFRELFGYDREELRELKASQLYADPAERERFRATIEQSGAVKDFEVSAVESDGTTFPCEITASTRVDADGEVIGYQGIARDVTEQRRFERQLEHQALHDELTGLPNRTLFWDRLEHALERGRRDPEGVRLAVLFLDLDRFKLVNDSLGHAAGDEILAQVARRLAGQFRAEDTVARVGGDEFTVLLEEAGSESEVRRAAIRFTEALEQPMRAEGETFHLTASVGIALSDEGTVSSPGTHVDEIVRRADSAMFRAKADPGSSVRVYDPDADVEDRSRLQRERALREGLERGEFTVHFQPIVRLESGRIVGAEPLARWEHPERGTVLPENFIELAEESGLIVPLGEALLEEAFRAAVAWTENERVADFVLHPNLSARQFEAPDLVASVDRILRSTGLDPARVRFEVTERVVMRGSERLDELRSLGVGVSIDDFGIGYSSLNYLKRLTVDALKIDLAFVGGIGEDPRDEAIVRTILTLGEAMGLEVVAEGIESPHQLELLRGLGCVYGQGFHFARPLPRDRFEALLEEQPLG